MTELVNVSSNSLDSSPSYRNFLKKAYSTHFSITDEQRTLTAKHLSPHHDGLERLISQLRDVADDAIQAQFTQEQHQMPVIRCMKHPTIYPLGYCDEIAATVYDVLVILITEPLGNFYSDFESEINALRLFKKEGGLIHQVYGIVQGPSTKYLQNEIQIGSYLADCAADTVEEAFVPERVKVKLWNGDNGVFFALTSFQQFAEAYEDYHDVKIYPMPNHMPRIATLFPLVTVFDDILIFPAYHNIVFRNVFRRLELTEQYLSTEHAKTKLDPIVEKTLAAFYSEREDFFEFDANGILTIKKALEMGKAEFAKIHLMTTPESERAELYKFVNDVCDRLENTRIPLLK